MGIIGGGHGVITQLVLSLLLLAAVPCEGFALLSKKNRKISSVAHVKASRKKKGILHGKAAQKVLSDGICFEQGMFMHNPFTGIVKSRKLYHQFSTLASFDVVKLDDQIVQDLVDKKSEMRALSQDDRDYELERMREELMKNHILYVLADVRTEHFGDLHDQNTQWRFLLKNQLSAQPVSPSKVVEADPDAETRLLFGENWKKISAFKTLYRVEFPRNEDESAHLSNALILSSPLVRDEIIWPAQRSGAQVDGENSK